MALGREDLLGRIWRPKRRYFSCQRFRKKLALAYKMRYNPTPSERKAWNIIRDVAYAQNPKVIFFRQYVLGGYIVDFFSPELALGIEIDGSIHKSRVNYDNMRDTNLGRYGVHIVRFANEEVWHEAETMKSKLLQLIKRLRRKK